MCKKDSFVIIEKQIGKTEKKLSDKYNVVYWTVFLVGKFHVCTVSYFLGVKFPFSTIKQFYILGVLCMLPWDMLVTVNGYWHYKFRNTTLDDVVLPENEALRTLLTPPGL